MTVYELRTEIRKGCDAIKETGQLTESLERIGTVCETADRIYAVGMGSSYWTGVMAASILRDVSCDTTAVSASEFAFTYYPVEADTLVVAFSQSGETAETIRAVRTASKAGATSVAIVNTADSTLDDIADRSFVTPAGTQETVLATKSVDAAVAAAYRIADAVAGRTGVDLAGESDYCRSMLDVDVSAAVTALEGVSAVYTLGVGVGYGLAGEAATKLGEGPLIHTTPLPLLEIAHGPYGNIDGDGVIVVATAAVDEGLYEDTIMIVREAGATAVVVAPSGADYGGDVTITYPAKSETIMPATKVIQRLATDLGVERNVTVDHLPDLDRTIDLSVSE